VQIQNQIRTLTLASMLALSVMSLPALQLSVHAEPNTGSGSGSGSSSTQCETSSGMFDPPTGKSYKSGTKVDVGTKVGDTSDHKTWTCNADGSWHEALILTQPVRELPAEPSAGATIGR
jgi:hypothetical protein